MSYTIDLQKIADELDFDLEDVEMLLEVFLDSSKEILLALKDLTGKTFNRLKESIEKNDLEAIFSSSHAIKGSAANLTLNEISDLAKEMEHNARESNNIDYNEKYLKLELLIKNIES